MKYSKTTLMELSHKYKTILRKCALLNAAILLGATFAFPAMAERSGGEDVASPISGTFSNGVDANGGAFYQTIDTNISDGAIFSGNTATSKGGALYNSANMTIGNNVQFVGNDAGTGGAIYNLAGGSVEIGDNAYFKDNTAAYSPGGGSDIKNYGTVSIGDNATFTRTTYQDPINDDIYDVSIFTMKGSQTTIGKNAVFKNIGQALNNEGNTTHIIGDGVYFEHNGSAITNFGGTYEIGDNATFKDSQFMTIANKGTGSHVTIGKNALFEGNSNPVFHLPSEEWVYMNGDGAVANNSSKNSIITFGDGLNVKSNMSSGKGVIYNVNTSTINFLGSANFENNTSENGVIYNTGTVNFQGPVLFSGNIDNSGVIVSDIYNTGTININGDLTLDGGVAGNGTMALADGVLLTAKAGITTIANNITNAGTSKLALTFANGFSEDTYQMVTGSLDQEFDIQQNSLYSILPTSTKGTYAITKKSTDQVVDNLVNKGATAQEAATISAIADTKVSNPVLDKITEAVQTGDVKTAAKAANDLAPTTSQAALGISKDVQSLLTSTAAARMASLAGRSGGDVFKGGSMWVQGLFNHTKQDSTSRNEGFKANSAGVAFGIDGKLNDAVTIGLGYGYTRTNADAGARDIDVDGNNVFAYAEYSPDAWYVNGVLNFGYGRYTEKKAPAGYTMKSKYDVYTYGANVMTGYVLESGLTPEGGLRYLLVDQKSYTDGVEKIKTRNNDVLTAVLGAKYGYAVKAKDWLFTPNVRLAATYDLMSDGSQAVAAITGGSSYQIKGERLHRLGMEAGVGVTSTWKNWDFTLSYDGGFRRDYQSHTGTLKAKYHF